MEFGQTLENFGENKGWNKNQALDFSFLKYLLPKTRNNKF